MVVYLAFIIYCFTTSSLWIRGKNKLYSLLYLEYFLSWFVSLFLLVLQHVKGLAEVFYCHKFYWFSAFVVQLVFFFVYNEHDENIVITLHLISICSTFILDVLSFYDSFCVKETVHRPYKDGLLSLPPVRDANIHTSNRPSSVSQMAGSEIYIRTKLIRKFNQSRQNGSPVYQFEVRHTFEQ